MVGFDLQFDMQAITFEKHLLSAITTRISGELPGVRQFRDGVTFQMHSQTCLSSRFLDAVFFHFEVSAAVQRDDLVE